MPLFKTVWHFCFRAGKDVFCEKPISKTDEGTAKCYDLAKKKGKTLFCAFNRCLGEQSG